MVESIGPLWGELRLAVAIRQQPIRACPIVGPIFEFILAGNCTIFIGRWKWTRLVCKYWGKSSCLQNMSEHVLLQLHNCLLQCLHKVNNTQTLNVVLVLLSTSARAFWFCILSLWMPEHKWMQLDKLIDWLLCTSVLESDWLEKRSHYGAANQSSPHNATLFPLQLNMYRLHWKIGFVCVNTRKLNV